MKKVKDIIEIIPQKTWETVQFKAVRTHTQGQETVIVECEYNHLTGKIRIYQANQEMVRFDEDTIEHAEMRALAVMAAIEYLKSIKK
jgi:bifunctional ADP-heptose synthase (sugar kinase/adenylyltransferase)